MGCISWRSSARRGWTTRGNADRYRELRPNEVLPGIEAKVIRGYREIEVLSIDRADEVEFVTIMTFDAMRNVIEFQPRATIGWE